MKLFKRPSPIWLEVLSDLFVEFAGVWFALVLIEPQLNPKTDILTLTSRIFFGILSLVAAKYFREKGKI